MSEFVSALIAEIAKLESELAHDVRFLRLRELWRVASLYGVGAASAVAPRDATHGSVDDGMTPQPSVAMPRRRGTSPDKERTVAEAKALLRGRAAPTPTAQILAHVETVGVRIPGEKPVNNLSAILSRSGEFTPHGRSGWTLKLADEDVEHFDGQIGGEGQSDNEGEVESFESIAN